MTSTNGAQSQRSGTLTRADEIDGIIKSTTVELVSFLRHADTEAHLHQQRRAGAVSDRDSVLVHPQALDKEWLGAMLEPLLNIKESGSGAKGFQQNVKTILDYSVNTFCPGFLDKLYAAPLAPGIAADLILSVLNTNLHVYQVSPVLTLIEKKVTKTLASLFGLNGHRSGGIGVQGGSASNLTSIVVARNTLYPETKMNGITALDGKLTIFTSAHGHYSIEKAAQALGFGSGSVVAVPVDSEGRMLADELERLILESKQKGEKPFYVNATAGSTVLGSFDPFIDISRIAKSHRMWFHIDGAWGGSFIFSRDPLLHDRLLGMEQADSIAINPHKMLGVPLTCSFLLGRDMRVFQNANTLKAGYLFHEADDEDYDETMENGNNPTALHNGSLSDCENDAWSEPYDLADLTLQCGRRGDSLKFFLCWQYYGTLGYGLKVDNAYRIACYLSTLVDQHPDLTQVLGHGKVPQCLQVCFYFTPNGGFLHTWTKKTQEADSSGTNCSKFSSSTIENPKEEIGRLNSKLTSAIAKKLINRGFMIDFAPALENQAERGSFFRVVVNISTPVESVERLVEELVNTGNRIVTGPPQNTAS